MITNTKKTNYKEDEIIDLRNSKLNEKILLVNIWPKIYVQQIKYMNISNNNIINIFYFQNNKAYCLLEGFEKLEYLDLSKNPIKETNANNLESLKNLKTLKLSKSEISKDHNLRFIKKLSKLESLILKFHKMYNLTLKGLINQIGSKSNLIHLDIRIIEENKNYLNENDHKILLNSFPQIKKYNGNLVKKLAKKNIKVNLDGQIDKSFTNNNKTPRYLCKKNFMEKINSKIQKDPSKNKSLLKAQRKNREKSISNLSKSDFKMYDSDDSFIGKKSQVDFNQSFDLKDKSEDENKTMKNFINIFHEKLTISNKENTEKNRVQKKKIEKYRTFFSKKLLN